jgi:hypothetical protein
MEKRVVRAVARILQQPLEYLTNEGIPSLVVLYMSGCIVRF